MALWGLAGVAVVCVAAAGLGGCSTAGYYAQAARGHLDLLARAKPVPEVIADGGTSAALRDKLALSQRIRDFAVSELHLPDNRSYRRYADLGRSAAVWNVVATPELSLKLKTWCFPVVGCIGYRGYYDRADADALAAQLKAEGWEAAVYGVPAYSTLGWSDWLGGDPLLNTFIGWSEGELARMVFHELAHQVAYADGDTAFNESFATAVERIGGERWLAEHGAPGAREAYAQLELRRRDFRALTLAARTDLEALYASSAGDEDKRRGKAERLARLRADYEQLKRDRWGGYTGYDAWFERAGNPSLAVQGAYNDLVPQFVRLHERMGRDFPRFYDEVRRLAALPMAERRAALQAEP